MTARDETPADDNEQPENESDEGQQLEPKVDQVVDALGKASQACGSVRGRSSSSRDASIVQVVGRGPSFRHDTCKFNLDEIKSFKINLIKRVIQ